VYNYCDTKDRKESIPSAQALAGWDTWQKKNCQTCHQLYGLGGYMGPDLTNVASNSGKDEKYLRTFIKYGTGKMPNFLLDDTEVSNVLAFLQWVDKSGKSKVAAENVTWSGNYNLEN
jgi:nitric oxide reductase subunit C